MSAHPDGAAPPDVHPRPGSGQQESSDATGALDGPVDVPGVALTAVA